MPDDDPTRHPDDRPRGCLLTEGQSFGQYKVIRLLGRGGMGEVYEVENPVLEKRYALKLMNRKIMERPDATERFKREAKVMARFEHPNIVKVDDFGEFEGLSFLRMELVGGLKTEAGDLRLEVKRAKEEDLPIRHSSESDGGKPKSGVLNSLADLLTGEPLPEALVVDLLKQILDGLAYAHEQGVVHRDLKPSNILFSSAPEGLSVNLAQLSGIKKTHVITHLHHLRQTTA